MIDMRQDLLDYVYLDEHFAYLNSASIKEIKTSFRLTTYF